MNNRVRIYELSRELNLDNKDIIEACEQLNIAVKSHSSTITESDAERIRAYADRYAVAPSPSPSKPSSGKSKPRKVANAQQKEKHKQEILEIRPSHISEAKRPMLKSPPKREAKPVAEAAVKQQLELKRPPQVKAPPSQQQEAEEGEKEREVTPAPPPPASVAPPPVPVSPPSPVPPKTVVEAANDEPAAKLAPPPVHPARPGSSPGSPARAKKSPERSGNSDGESRRPVLRKPKQDPARKADGAASARSTGPKDATTDAATGRKTIAAPSKADRGESASTDSEKSGEEAVEEKRPAAKTGREATDKPAANRPKTARSLKKQKKRVDRDEDTTTRTDADKFNKAGKKIKRPKPIKEDDDFDDDLKDGLEAEEVSLSLARPPKPKSQQAAKTPPAPKTTSRPTRRTAGHSPSSSNRQRQVEPKKQRPQELKVAGSMTVRELADGLCVAETDIVKVLFVNKGIAVNITQTLDFPTLRMVAEEFGVRVEAAERQSAAIKTNLMLDDEDLDRLQDRPPVVTVMGHVDHGKTTLLDAIRQANVAQGEAGGITQHIGAYHVDVERTDEEGDVEMRQVVFLDTPGHEAFTAMRARGARVTDIAILVVAADDGVRPQTIEAISHARAAGVPLVIAINKVDKEGAQLDRVKQELMEYELVPEEWGGDAIMVPVSAITREGIDTLLEMLLLVAEVEEFSANPNRLAKGTIVEAHLDKTRGAMATFLVQNGTLHVGDVLVAGSTFGKVRAMIDDRGNRVEEVGPSSAVQVLGLADVPAAGDEFDVFESEKEARAIADKRAIEQRQRRLTQGVSLGSLSAQAQEGELKQLNLILKADVQGSIEAIRAALEQLPQHEVQLRLLLAAPGEIGETDIDLAAASGAVIIGFNTTYAPGALKVADRMGVDAREYSIIYELLDDIQGAMEGLLEPEMVEEPLGVAEVRAIFPVSKGSVAGCYISSGKAIRNCKIRVKRGSNVLYVGNLDSLRRMRDDVKEVNAGYECGIGVSDFNAWEEGDAIETFRMVTKRRSLTPAASGRR